ncbi:MAG: hypothetical protein V3U79_03135 [Dehalococcoidia bacterium]
MKKGDGPSPGVKARVQKLAASKPRPTNREIREAIEKEYAVTIADRTIRRYCVEGNVPTSSRPRRKRGVVFKDGKKEVLKEWLRNNLADALKAVEAVTEWRIREILLAEGRVIGLPDSRYRAHQRLIIESIRKQSKKLRSLEEQFGRAKAAKNIEEMGELVGKIRTLLDEWLTP